MHTLSAIDLRNKFIQGDLTAVEITNHFLARIDRYNQDLGAFLAVFHERALQKAKNLDEKRRKGEKLGKLAAIPIALKDNIHVAGEISTCGSQFLLNYRAPFDATVTRLIEAEDGIIIGKTNMDEFAMGSSTENSSIQKTFNPWNLKCSPGGSSGGSAAAVAARLCPLALGSDTGGSIRQPASLCGIVGFKPTYGRVSRYGLVAYGSSLDQIGPLATSTADAALLVEVIGQHCDKDSTSLPMPGETYPLQERVAGMRFGVPRQFIEGLAADQQQIFNNSLETLKSLGGTIVDVDLSSCKYAIAVYYILATAEASTNLARFDGIRYGKRSARAKTLDEVYELSKEEGFGPEVKRRILLGTFVLSAGYQDAYYKKAQKVRTLLLQEFKKAFEKCHLVVSPAAVNGAFEIGAIKDPLQMYLEDIYTIPSNLVGIPAISVPSAFTKDNKPVGLQFMGPQKQEAHIFPTAHAFELANGSSKKIPPLYQENLA